MCVKFCINGSVLWNFQKASLRKKKYILLPFLCLIPWNAAEKLCGSDYMRSHKDESFALRLAEWRSRRSMGSWWLSVESPYLLWTTFPWNSLCEKQSCFSLYLSHILSNFLPHRAASCHKQYNIFFFLIPQIIRNTSYFKLKKKKCSAETWWQQTGKYWIGRKYCKFSRGHHCF